MGNQCVLDLSSPRALFRPGVRTYPWHAPANTPTRVRTRCHASRPSPSRRDRQCPTPPSGRTVQAARAAHAGTRVGWRTATHPLPPAPRTLVLRHLEPARWSRAEAAEHMLAASAPSAVHPMPPAGCAKTSGRARSSSPLHGHARMALNSSLSLGTSLPLRRDSAFPSAEPIHRRGQWPPYKQRTALRPPAPIAPAVAEACHSELPADSR